MIRHGMDALLMEAPRDGLARNFDTKRGWAQVLDTYRHCPSR
jgi:hypothetical protein